VTSVDLSPQGQQTLSRYVNRGWLNAAGDARLRDDHDDVPRDHRWPFSWKYPRPAYLVIASGMMILPSSEVQVTTRCHYRAFRGRQLVVVSDDARNFDLLDLKVMYRSQFRRDAILPLRGCADEATPELIQWPLEVCGAGVEIVASAIIPQAVAATAATELGARFEIMLIGEVLI
jgi:hypothetical protein